jgi:YebC/PmpR family DNA-binding regulatory protein
VELGYNNATLSLEGNMAGHSKWANIKHKKAAADAKRGKVFTRLIKEITVASRMANGELESPRLRLAVDKALAANMPKETIERAINRGAGNVEGAQYDEARYEGYGIGGAAIIVDCLTDNKTRTVADVRHAFSKFGGNMGTDGCVAYQFTHCGTLLFSPEIDEAQLIEKAIELGANDVVTHEDGAVEIITPPYEFTTIKQALETDGLHAEIGEVTMRAQNDIELSGEDAERMQKILNALEDLDDVQAVYTNAILNEEG